MKTLAVVMQEPQRLALSRLDLTPPGDDDVVVEMAWSGISTGTEKLLWSGRMPAFPGMGYPLVPGYESVGRISTAGHRSGRAVGQAVYVPGAKCYGEVRGLFRRALTEAGYMTLRTGGSQDAREQPVFVVEPTFRGNLLIGSSRRFLGEDTTVDHQLVRDIMARAVHFSSRLASVPVIRTFAGLRPWTPDNRPIVGEVPDLPGYVLATGHEGEGIGLAPATAEMVAGVVRGLELPPVMNQALEDFSPGRFLGEDAKWAASV